MQWSNFSNPHLKLNIKFSSNSHYHLLSITLDAFIGFFPILNPKQKEKNIFSLPLINKTSRKLLLEVNLRVQFMFRTLPPSFTIIILPCATWKFSANKRNWWMKCFRFLLCDKSIISIICCSITIKQRIVRYSWMIICVFWLHKKSNRREK